MTRTIVCFGLTDQTALEALSIAMGTPYEVSGTLHLHAELAPSVSPTGRFRFEQVVPRADLDVEQDWWRTGQGGEVEPIGEFVDHIHAVITIRDEVGRLLVQAETPTVTASWGALGDD